MKIQYHIFTLLVLFYSCRQTRNAYSIKTANGYYYSFLSTDTTVTEALKNNISPISIKNQFPGMILFENQIIVKQENDIFEPEHRQIELFSFPEQYNWYKKIHIDYQGNEKIKDNDQVKGTNIFDLSKVGNFYEIKGFFFTSDFLNLSLPQNFIDFRKAFNIADSISRSLFYYVQNYNEYKEFDIDDEGPIAEFNAYKESFIEKFRPPDHAMYDRNFHLRYEATVDSLCSYDAKYYILLKRAIEYAIKNKKSDGQLADYALRMSKKDAIILKRYYFSYYPNEEGYLFISHELFKLAEELKDTTLMKEAAITVFLVNNQTLQFYKDAYKIKKEAINFLLNLKYDFSSIIIGSIISVENDYIYSYGLFNKVISVEYFNETFILPQLIGHLKSLSTMKLDQINLINILNFIDSMQEEIKNKAYKKDLKLLYDKFFKILPLSGRESIEDPFSVYNNVIFSKFSGSQNEWIVKEVHYGHIDNLPRSIITKIKERDTKFSLQIHDTIGYQAFGLNSYIPLFEKSKSIILANPLIKKEFNNDNIKEVICHFKLKQPIIFSYCQNQFPEKVIHKMNQDSFKLTVSIVFRDDEEIIVYFFSDGSLLMTQIPTGFDMGSYCFEDIVTLHNNGDYKKNHLSYRLIDIHGKLENLAE